jgi:hypothetical protein
MAPALRALTIPFIALTVFMLGRAWYLELGRPGHGRGIWLRRSRNILILSTVASATLWGLRFGGFLGMRPF